VISQLTMDQIAETSNNTYGKGNKKPQKKKKVEKSPPPTSKKAVKKTIKNQVDPENTEAPEPELDVAAILKKGKKEKFSTAFIKPMLATLVDEPFDDSGWEYEVKWDGYRTIAFIDQSKVELKSRNNKSFNEKFYPILEAVKNWDINAIVDGEIVVADEKGISQFNSLQNWRSEADGDLLFYVFDVLWLDGKNLMNVPLNERKAVLQSLVPEEGIIRVGFGVKAKGTEFFDVAKKMGLEGIIAKRSDSLYNPGDRTKDWLKIKVQKRQEVIIAGYTKNEG